MCWVSADAGGAICTRALWSRLACFAAGPGLCRGAICTRALWSRMVRAAAGPGLGHVHILCCLY